LLFCCFCCCCFVFFAVLLEEEEEEEKKRKKKMQLNRVLGRVRLVRPRRMPVAAVLVPRTYVRLINTTRSTTTTTNSHFPNRIESKMDKTVGDKSSDAARATGVGMGTGTGAATTGYASDNKGNLGSSAGSSGSGFGSTSTLRAPTEKSSSDNNFADRSSSSGSSGSSSSSGSGFGSSSGSGFGSGSGSGSGSSQSSFGGSSQSSFGRSSSFPSSSSSSSSSPSSSEGFVGSKNVSDRNSNDFGFPGESRSGGRGGERERGNSLGEKVSEMADKVSEKFSDSSSGSFGETASRMADKVSEKFSGGNKNDQQKYTRENKYSGDTDRSYSETNQPASNYGKSNTDFGKSTSYGRPLGDNSYEGSSSSENETSFRDAANKMTSKISDKVSEGSSAIGQTLHKISDKISETFSGNKSDNYSSSQGQGNYSSSQGNSSSSEGRMTSSRRGGQRDSSISPFDLSSFFRNNFFGDWGEGFSSKALSMRTDIIEHDSEYRVICDLPGVSKKDINISLRKNYLEINGERSEGHDESTDDHTVHCQERYFGSFTRRLTLPSDASKDMSSIKARCDNGVLTVTIPKSQHSSRDRYNVNIE